MSEISCDSTAPLVTGIEDDVPCMRKRGHAGYHRATDTEHVKPTWAISWVDDDE